MGTKHVRATRPPRAGQPASAHEENRAIELRIAEAMRTLNKSLRGKRVLRDLRKLATNGANELDLEGGAALVTLVRQLVFGRRDFLAQISGADFCVWWIEKQEFGGGKQVWRDFETVDEAQRFMVDERSKSCNVGVRFHLDKIRDCFWHPLQSLAK